MNEYTQQYKITDDTITRFDFNFNIAQGSSVNVYYWNGALNTTPNEANDIVAENLYTLFYNSEKDSTDGYIEINFDISTGGELTITPTLKTVIDVDFTQTSQLNPENLNKAFAQLTDPLNYMFSLYKNLSFRYNANADIDNISSYNILLPPLEDQSFYLRSGENIVNERISDLQEYLASTLTGYMLEIDSTNHEGKEIELVDGNGVPWKNVSETDVSVFKNGLRLTYAFNDFTIDNSGSTPLLILTEALIASDKLTITTSENQGKTVLMEQDGNNFISDSKSRIARNDLRNLTNREGNSYYLTDDNDSYNVAFCNTSKPIYSDGKELILDNSHDKSAIYLSDNAAGNDYITLPLPSSANIGYSFTMYNPFHIGGVDNAGGLQFTRQHPDPIDPYTYPSLFVNGVPAGYDQVVSIDKSIFTKLTVTLVENCWYVVGDIAVDRGHNSDYYGNVRVANSTTEPDVDGYKVPNINYLNEVINETNKAIDETNEAIDELKNETNEAIDETNEAIDELKNETNKAIDETNEAIDELKNEIPKNATSTVYTDIYQGTYSSNSDLVGVVNIDLTDKTKTILQNCKYAKFKIAFGGNGTWKESRSPSLTFTFTNFSGLGNYTYLFANGSNRYNYPFVQSKSDDFSFNMVDFLTLRGGDSFDSLDFNILGLYGCAEPNSGSTYVTITLVEYING